MEIKLDENVRPNYLILFFVFFLSQTTEYCAEAEMVV